jgi:hypothetical protein
MHCVLLEMKDISTKKLTQQIYLFRHTLCWATGWTIGVLGFDSRRGLGIFLFTTASRPAVSHPASYPMGIRGSFPGGKAAGA